MRRMIDKIMISSFAKREVHRRILDKLSEARVTLTTEQNKMMIYALMGNHPDIQSFMRKLKIEAYDIEKKKYDEFLK